MTDLSLTHDRVLDLIAIYGADPEVWPEAERAAARRHLSVSPEVFADALAEAHALDACLARVPVPQPDPSLANRIMATAPKMRRRQAAPVYLFRWSGRRSDIGAALAALAVGLVAGYATASEAVDPLIPVETGWSVPWETSDELPFWLKEGDME